MEVCVAMHFVTMVQIRSGGASPETGSRVAAHADQWQHLNSQIQLVGGRVTQIWNVLGNDYDLMFLGEADDPKTLHRIDAVCKSEGYMSRTHPAIEAAEYAQLVEDTADVLSYGGRQRQRQEVERDEA
jgi:uncharacterized protein with GYD domain